MASQAASTLRRIPVRTGIMDDLDAMIRAHRSLVLSARGADAVMARTMWKDRIMPRLEAIVRGNFDCLGYPAIREVLDRLTRPQ